MPVRAEYFSFYSVTSEGSSDSRFYREEGARDKLVKETQETKMLSDTIES